MSTDLYADEFYSKRVKYCRRAPVMCQGIIDMWHPKTVIDAGCALGDLVNEFINQKIDAVGIEGNNACLPYIQCPSGCIRILDLSKKIDLGRRFSVAISLEVAEHIEEQYADIYINNMCKFSNILVMSVCDYGETNKIHCNVKTRSYWIKKFDKKGYIQRPEKETELKDKWFSIRQASAVKEAYRNLIIFERA